VGELEQAQALVALGELRTLVHRLGEEVGSFRRRALQAEARVRELEGALAAATRPAAAPAEPAEGEVTPERVAALERENVELRRRLEEAATRLRQLLDRAKFLRQQEEEEKRS
jgi:hypothetical protein